MGEREVEQTDTAAAELRSTSAHWDARFASRASVEQRASTYALAHPLYQRLYVDPHFADDGSDWLEWVRRRVAPDGPRARALVLGCGVGDGLIDMHRRGIARRLHGIDLSATAIERSRALAARAGVSADVTFEVGDFHAVPLEPGVHDLVFMIGSLHHALALDAVLERVRMALVPGGVFLANEYVGPSRWQYTLPQLLCIKALLTLLPRRLRRRANGSLKGRVGRPTLAWMLATDPSEAAHSAEIPARFAAHFRQTDRVDYGGAITLPVLDEIIASFDPESRSDLRWLRAVLATDRLAWKSGLVPSANALLVGVKD